MLTCLRAHGQSPFSSPQPTFADAVCEIHGFGALRDGLALARVAGCGWRHGT
jgi:hypothetical protein